MEEQTNIKPKREDTGNEPKKWSKNPNSAKYHSRSAEYKAQNKKKWNVEIGRFVIQIFLSRLFYFFFKLHPKNSH